VKWTIEFGQEAANYAVDSHPYNEDVLIAIEQLAASKEGWPVTGHFQIMENWCIWEIAEHIVVYEVERFSMSIIITVIKPAE
jgi:hypothetical protein